MKERIIILGAGVMQGPAIRISKDMGLETFVVDANPGAVHAQSGDHFRCIDLKDKEGIEAFARELKQDGGLSGIMTAGTDFSATVAWVAEKLGLPGIPYEAALDASDKQRMRSRFKAAGVPSPEFIILKEIPGPGFSLPFGYPVVVKPVDNMGSRGCRKVTSGTDLADAVRDALGFSRSGRAILEEFMDGPEFSVDAIIFNGEITICGLADRHIFFPPYFIEMGHTMPTDLDMKTREALLDTFRQGVRALGLTNGAGKGDVKLTSRGPMIGEIAARLSGGYMSGWTYPYSSGVEPTRGAVMAALGKKPNNLVPLKHWTCAERAFISIPGKIASVRGMEEAESVPFVKDLFMRVGEGSTVRFPENNVSKCGNCISAAPGREEAVHSAETAARMLLFRLEAPNEETRAFLETDTDFPPSAFSLSGALLEELRNLPGGNHIPQKGQPIPLCPFPGFTGSGLLDYTGRSIRESLDAAGALTGTEFRILEQAGSSLGREFWQALIRGGYQGAVYHIDTLMSGRG